MFRAVSKAVFSGLSASKSIQTRTIYVGVRLSKGETPDDIQVPPVPVYKYKANETMQERRARLLYQSRKRGMLENGLLLSQFAKKFLDKLTDEQVLMYDKLINLPSNDWDIYYWATNKQEPPKEFENEVLEMLREHATNKDMESRIRQPDLYT